MTIVPEVFPGNICAIANIRPTTVRQPFLRERDETWVPQTKKDAWGKHALPVGLLGDNVVHQPEEAIRVILNFDVHVEFDLLVLGLFTGVRKIRGSRIQSLPA